VGGGDGGILGPFADYRAAITYQLTTGFASDDIGRVSGGAGAGLFEFVGPLAKPSGGTANLNWFLPSKYAALVRAGKWIEDGSSNPIQVNTANGGGSDTANTLTTKWTKVVTGGTGDITDDAGDIKFAISGGVFSTVLEIPWTMAAGKPNPVLVLFEMKGTYIPDPRASGGGWVQYWDNFSDANYAVGITHGGAVNRLGLGGTTALYSWTSTRGQAVNCGTVNMSGDFAPVASTFVVGFASPPIGILADGSTPANLFRAWEVGEGTPEGVWLGPPYNTCCMMRQTELAVAATVTDLVRIGVTTDNALKNMWLRRLAVIELGAPP
jgi:hypothetical protein